MIRARRAAVAAALAVAGIPGCGLEFTAEEPPIANTCDTDGDCGGGACVTVDDRQTCVATQADLAGVIFQLEGTTDDGVAVSHVFVEGVSVQGESASGAIKDLGGALDVPAPFALTGRFLHPQGVIPGCTDEEGALPVKVEARPAKELAGLQQVFTGGSTPESNRFLVALPAGRYDVYIVPQLTGGCASVPVVPPVLFRDIDVDPDVLLEPEAELPKRLTGFVIPVPDRDLQGFVVDLVDAERGLPVSEAVPLGPPNDDGEIPIGKLEDGADVASIPYYTPVGGSGLVLRISDPDGALVVQWQFESLDLDGDGSVECDLGDLIANPKDLEANVIDEQNRPIAGASVTIKSESLTGSASKNASFEVTTTSDTSGKIRVSLVPGTYQVAVVPPDESGPATLVDTWDVKANALCCGKSFPLESRSLITARVGTERDAGVDATAVPVLATPSLPRTRTYFQTVIDPLQVLPRQSAGTTDGNGAFALAVDAGLYDVSIRPGSATGFPWLVLPSVVVAPPASKLEDVVIPNPALFIGRATSEGVPVTGATLRAYLPLASSETKDTSPVRVVQIGETIVGDDGRFVLAVPPSVTRVIDGTSDTSSSSSGTSTATGNFQP